MTKKVFFLIRAYNDLDCRLSLINNFANQSQYKVSIISIPTNNGINDFKHHEILGYLDNSNVHYQTIFDLNNRYIPKILYWLYNIIQPRKGVIGIIFNRLKQKIFKVIVFISYRSNYWFEDIIKSFDKSIIIIDEVVFQKNRSFFVDELIEHKDHFSIYSFITGQDTYLNLWHDKDISIPFEKLPSLEIPLFVPSENDRRINQKNFPDVKVITVGNTRFDLPWVKKLSSLAKKDIKANDMLKKTCEHKIIFMLSKIEYGVDLDNIIEIINECAKINNSLVILKPHTRGMTIDIWKDRLNSSVLDGSVYSSSVLIEWADTVLFTGSSIVFQAMILHKKVIFLKYCQKYETIFDKVSSICLSQNLQNTIDYVKKVSIDSIDSIGLDKFVKVHTQNGLSGGIVCKSVVNLIENMEGKNRA